MELVEGESPKGPLPFEDASKIALRQPLFIQGAYAYGSEISERQSEGDPRLWKIIISPEFGERVDLTELTRQLMTRMEKDLGTRLEWLAVIHRNTKHPHVHIALGGIRDVPR